MNQLAEWYFMDKRKLFVFSITFFLVSIMLLKLYDFNRKMDIVLEDSSKFMDETTDIVLANTANKITNKVEEENGSLVRRPASVPPIKSNIIFKSKHIEKIDFNDLPKFKSSGLNYKIVPHYKVVTINQLSIYKDYRLIEKKFNMAIIETDEYVESNKWVVYNTQTEQLGILTGIIKAKLANSSHKYKLADKYNLNIYQDINHLNLVLYQISDLQQLENTLEQLKLQTGVVRVSAEILETNYQHK